MESKHTPGAWKFEQPNGLNVFDRETHVIKQVRKDGREPNWVIAEVSHARDARLIAACPEMLNALIVARDANELAHHLVTSAEERLASINALAVINSAIAKAMGDAK